MNPLNAFWSLAIPQTPWKSSFFVISYPAIWSFSCILGPLHPENKEIDCSYVLHCVHLDKPLLCAQHQWAETVSSGIAITGKASLVSGQHRMTEKYGSVAAILNPSKICRTKWFSVGCLTWNAESAYQQRREYQAWPALTFPSSLLSKLSIDEPGEGRLVVNQFLSGEKVTFQLIRQR